VEKTIVENSSKKGGAAGMVALNFFKSENIADEQKLGEIQM